MYAANQTNFINGTRVQHIDVCTRIRAALSEEKYIEDRRRISYYNSWFDNEFFLRIWSGCARIGRICFGTEPRIWAAAREDEKKKNALWKRRIWKTSLPSRRCKGGETRPLLGYGGRCKNKSFLFKPSAELNISDARCHPSRINLPPVKR